MKKMVLAGLIAIAAIAFSQQQASAWVNTRFSVGLNWSCQSGGNQLLWGAWRNGQPPGPEAYGGHAPMQGFPYFGNSPMPQAPDQSANYSQPMPQPQYSGQYASPFQFANYPRPIYYYPAPTYYYNYGQ